MTVPAAPSRVGPPPVLYRGRGRVPVGPGGPRGRRGMGVGMGGGWGLPVLFAFALLLSAALLFVLEPLVARLVLPLLGGTPGVWNTCMVFFQAELLAGYAYAHAAPAGL